MNEKFKKYLYLTAYRAAVAAAVFVAVSAVGFFVPEAAQKIKNITTRNTDFNKVIGLFFRAVKELLPF